MSQDQYRFPSPEERPRGKILVVGVGLLLLVIAALYVFAGRDEKIAHMSAVDAHLAIGSDAAGPVTQIDRDQTPEIYYHVVLRDVPLGWTLQLGCEWMDPHGAIARQNFYETRWIHKSTWPTHCRQQFSTAAEAGEWKVRMLSGERVLSTSSFLLK
ncbi:MAG: hypothetical protein DMG13_12870 [Acidobacteria bacterium]|nr:MAG: hypothetical protein DMG13_12870 [Acidobacteriota bacterium]